MKPEDSNPRNWDDLVFENRNREYGAYVLRKSYARNVGEGLLFCLAFVVVIFSLPKISSLIFGDDVHIPKKADPQVIHAGLVPEIILDRKIEPARKIFTKSTARLIPIVTTAQVVETIEQPPTDQNATASTLGDGQGLPIEGTEVGTGTSEVVVPVQPNKIFDIVEVMPSYAGGLEAMMRFLQNKMKYPYHSRVNGIEGTVYVQFVVNTEGKVVDVTLARGISTDCDKEAMRVIGMLPGWKPGIQNHVPVSVRMVLPVRFKLAE